MQLPRDPSERLRKIMRVSKHVRQDQMRDALEMEAADFNRMNFD